MTGHEQYLLALDAGTTSVKAVLFDGRGGMKARCVCEYELEKPAPDIVEVDPETYWEAAKDAIADVLAASEVPASDIVSVGVTSQAETLIVLDAEGVPLRKAIVWLDNRSKTEAERIAGHFGREQVYRTTGQQEIVPTWTATKILWLRKHEPELFRRAAKFLMVEDYLIYRLTDRFATDRALNPSTLYYDLSNGDWWDEMLGFLGITREQLPDLHGSGANVGTLKAEVGLDAKTVVTTAPIDQVAGAVGAGNIAPGMITETTGSALAVCATLPKSVFDPKMRVGLYGHAVSGRYVMMPWVPVAGMLFRWFRDTLGGSESYLSLEREAELVASGSDGLIVLPHLSGSFFPDPNADARGVFHGVTLAHTRGHFVRAIFESVAFMLRDCVEMLDTLGISCSRVSSLGGGANCDFWLQIKADVLNREMVVPECSESTCLGAAILSTVGTGYYASMEEAVKKMVHIKKTVMPNPEAVARYEQIYLNYRELNNALLPTFGGK